MPITTVTMRPVFGSSINRLTLPTSLPSEPRTGLPRIAFASTSKPDAFIGFAVAVGGLGTGAGPGAPEDGVGFAGLVCAGCGFDAAGFADWSCAIASVPEKNAPRETAMISASRFSIRIHVLLLVGCPAVTSRDTTIVGCMF